MTRKKHTPTLSKIIPTNNTPNYSAEPWRNQRSPGLTYAQALNHHNQLSPILHHGQQQPIGQPHFQPPIWQHYLDQNPWTFASKLPDEPKSATSKSLHNPLPLPPDPTHPAWRARCYNCLELGNDQKECRCPVRVCVNCWGKGHEARMCNKTPLQKKPSFDPLLPRGNAGEGLFPTNRPQCAMVFIPETFQMQQDAMQLYRAIIVDSSLKPNHTTHLVQSVLMAICSSDYPLPLTYMAGHQYLLLLPQDIDHHSFLQSHDKSLQDLGLVTYLWSPAINGCPIKIRYKSWIELK